MRTCSECPRRFKPKRPHHVCCSQECRSQRMVRLQVEEAQAAPQRVSAGVGSRGGNVRSKEQADYLHRQYKEQWTSRIRRHLAATLLQTGRFFCDDMAPLEVPEEHSAIIGSQTASFAAQGYMVAIGRRRVEHKAANSRKANVYEVTAKGREELPKLVGVGAVPRHSSGNAGLPGTNRGIGADSGEPEQLFTEQDGSTMYDPFSEAA